MISTQATGSAGAMAPGQRQVRSRLCIFTPWILAGSLLISNIATLLSDRIHNAAYNIVATIASTAGHIVADAVLSRSPTRAKANAVNIETRRLQTASLELEAKNRALQREKEIVTASKVALAKEHDALRVVTAKRASAVKAMASRTTSVLASRSAEAISTLPVRAAPYVGIAALIAFTTWELKADCNLARALAELNADHGNDPIDTGKVCGAVDSVPTPQQAWAGVKSHSSTALKATYEGLESTANRLGLTIYTHPLK